jgi:hypothetical protein
MLCSIADCEGEAKYKGLCGKHYKRQWRHGNPLQTAYRNKELGLLCKAEGCARFARRNGYCNICSAVVYRYGTPIRYTKTTPVDYDTSHRKRAAIALGKALPINVVVHHHYGKPDTLVICPDQTYHMLIHDRMRKLFYENLREE